MSGRTAWVETYRGGVDAWECDGFGHLNIAFYGERFSDAGAELMQRLAPGSRWRLVGLAARYQSELRAGESLAIRSAVIAAADGELRLGHEMLRSDGSSSTLAEERLVPQRGEDAAQLASLAGAAQGSDAAPFAPLALPPGEMRIAAGLDRVKPREADGAGALSLLGAMHRFSTACLHVLDAIGMSAAYRQQEKRGFATFETRFSYESAAWPGEGVQVTSRILAIGTSSLRMLHHLRESATGRPVAQLYQAGVNFDLEARRGAVWQPALRERALELRVAAAS